MAAYACHSPCTVRPFHSKMGFADTECAEALLELAASVSPPAPAIAQQRPPDLASVVSGFLDAALRSELRDIARSSKDDSEPKWQEMQRRVCLDHNYFWDGDKGKADNTAQSESFRSWSFKSYCNDIHQAVSSPRHDALDDVDLAPPNSHIKSKHTDPKWNKENNYLNGVKLDLGKAEHVLSSFTKISPPTRAIGSDQKPGGKRVQKRSFSDEDSLLAKESMGHPARKRRSSEGVKCDSTQGATSSPQYLSDDRYKGFNLLLKCLSNTEDDSSSHDTSSLPDHSSSSNDGFMDYGSDSETESEDETGLRQPHSAENSELEYKCTYCSKSFSKKRYLTKHSRRMHHSAPISFTHDDVATACPNCLKLVSKRNLKRHLAVCEEVKKPKKSSDQDMSACQFCGIRMKRHLLVKHLAQEHCVERNFDLHISSADDGKTELYEQDSSSSHDNVVCDVCFLIIPRTLVKQHMIANHGALVSIPNSVSPDQATANAKPALYASAKHSQTSTVNTSSQKATRPEPSFAYALSMIKAQGGRKRSSSESATASLERSIKDRDLQIVSQRSHLARTISPSSGVQSMQPVSQHKSPQTSPKMLHVGTLQTNNLAIQSFQQSNPVIIAAANQSLPYTVTSVTAASKLSTSERTSSLPFTITSLSAGSKPSPAQLSTSVWQELTTQALGVDSQHSATSNLVISKMDTSDIPASASLSHVQPSEHSPELKTRIVICSSKDSSL